MERVNTRLTTGKVRFSFTHVFAPRAMDGSDLEKYSTTILVPKSDMQTMQRINAAIEAAKTAGTNLWGGKIPSKLATPIYDGDATRPNGEEFGAECKNCYVFTASSTMAPGVVDIACNPIINQGEFYSGCYGRAAVNFFAYNKNGNRGIGCGLNNVQKLADGEPLAGRSRPEDDFGDDFKDTASDLLG